MNNIIDRESSLSKFMNRYNAVIEQRATKNIFIPFTSDHKSFIIPLSDNIKSVSTRYDSIRLKCCMVHERFSLTLFSENRMLKALFWKIAHKFHIMHDSLRYDKFLLFFFFVTAMK